MNIFRYTAVFYFVIGFFIFGLVDYKRAAYDHLNYLNIENYLCQSQSNNIPLTLLDLNQGIHYYQEWMALRPSDEAGYLNEGYCYAQLGRTDKALKLYKKAIALNPEMYFPYLDIATIYLASGKQEEAKPYLKESLKRLRTSESKVYESLKTFQRNKNNQILAVLWSLKEQIEKDRQLIFRYFSSYPSSELYNDLSSSQPADTSEAYKQLPEVKKMKSQLHILPFYQALVWREFDHVRP